MKNLLFVICLMFLSDDIFGQVFGGRIITENGSPVSRAYVINTTRPSADMTGKDGRFHISAEYGDTLLIDTGGGISFMKCVYTETMQDIVYKSSELSYAFPYFDDKVLKQINTLYLLEKYKDCIVLCRYYIRTSTYFILSDQHPYRNWRKKQTHLTNYQKVEDVIALLYLACISTYKYTMAGKWGFEELQWSRACVTLIDDYLHENIPDDSWTAEMIHKYITYGKWGMRAIECGQHFLAGYERERWVNKELHWFDEKFDKISDILYKNTVNRQTVFSNYPLLRYEIGTICYNHALKKGDYKLFEDYMSKRIDATKDFILQFNSIKTFGFESIEIYEALHSLKSVLCSSVIEKDLCDAIGDNFERFCMEKLTILQDLSYFLNGSSRYYLSTNYSLRDIQNKLRDDDCAILHFEAPVASGRLYSRYDLSTRFRNYALIITKNQERPDVWHRGYISDSVVNDLSVIKKRYPNAKRFFYVGTPRMSFIDIAGTDSSIVRLHSLSQLLNVPEIETDDKEITFIGDLNYRKVGEVSSTSDYKGSPVFNELIGSAKELMRIKELFTNVRPICGDDATRNVVMSEIGRNKGILHISTHGHIFSSDYEFGQEDLILKRNIMENSRLILSEYNDAPNSPMSYISGSDVLKLKKINSSIVFLDACSSGNGSVGAFGSVGIAEAFHLIGAKNVICYLDSIKDEIATDFSNKFYLELSKGKSCHDAFYIAKKSVNQNIKVVLWE